MFRSLIASILLASLLVATTRAQDFDKIKLAGNNLAHEHLICGAYFAIVSECMKTRPDIKGSEATSARYHEISMTMARRGNQFGLQAGVSEKASLARFEIAMKEMFADTDQSCTNISVLFAKHGDGCVKLAEHPEERLRELMGE